VVEPLDPQVVLRAVSQSADAVVIVDRKGVIGYWNRGAERIFGYDASDAIGSTLDVIIPQRLRQRHWDAFGASMVSGASKYEDGDLLAVPAITADGTTISIEFSMVMSKDVDGRVQHVGALIRDVTATWVRRRDMERRLEELEGQRQQN
jgi:PAS domain S-box-containing protein